MNKAIGTSTIKTLQRDQYGALNLRQVLPPELQTQVAAFTAAAVKAGLLPEPFINGNAKEYECLNLDTYDVLIFRGKVKSLVVQVRTFWKNVRKGYSRSGKDYFLITRIGRKITMQTAEKATCAKRAKNTTALGQLVQHYLGKQTIACKKPATPITTAYKVLAKTADGRLIGAYDDSEYKLGKWRSVAAEHTHDDGFFDYLDDALSLNATKRNHAFPESLATGKTLVLCKVEIKGKEIEYGGGKWAAPRLRVIEELGEVATTIN